MAHAADDDNTLASHMPLVFEDIVSLQSTSSVYKMSSPPNSTTEGSFALKCVTSSGGTKSLEYEWNVLLQLKGVKNITEAFALRRNIVTSEDIFPKEDLQKTILVQRFFKAAPVHKLFCMFPHLDETVVRAIIVQVITILKEVHEHGVVYVDLKLPNILLANNGTIKLVDFGSSVVLAHHHLDGREDGEIPRGPFLHGTVHVRAPELFGEHLYVQHPKMLDVWALGVCAYEMLSGQPLPLDTAALNSAQPVISWPAHVSASARDFVEALLRVDVTHRLGFEGGVASILEHSYLAGICTDDGCTLPEEYEEEVDMQTLGL